VHRYEDAMPLCEDNVLTEKCVKLRTLTQLVKQQPNPTLQSLRLMYSFSKVFANLWKQG